MPAPIALTRGLSTALERCELTCLPRQPLDVARAARQHAAYTRALARLGCQVHQLPGHPELADCVFVEDTAVVLDDVAVITRPGAASRRPETRAVARALRRWRPLLELGPPATLDGGDVLRMGQTFYVGLSTRSNRAGFTQLRELLAPRGYTLRALAVHHCLHLKTAVSAVSGDTVLINPDWCDPGDFRGYHIIPVDPAEPWSANTLVVGGTVLLPEAFPGTRQRLEDAGFRTLAVPVDELAKAEGGVSCCSLIFQA